MDVSWIIPYILSILNLLILAYNIKLNRESFQLKQWTETLQHASLLVRLEGVTDLQISLTNVGSVPIDKMQVKVEGSIRNKTEPKFSRKYTSKSILLPKETIKIPLFRDLEPYLTEQKMFGVHYEHMPSDEKDIWGETIFVKEGFKHILKPFSMNLSLKTTFKVHKVAKKVPQEFLASYDYIPEYGDPRQTGDPECRYSDNFEVKIQEVQWSS